MKDLSVVSEKEQQDFFNSFDYVFCDVDGVLWHFQEQIPGAAETLKALKTLNKKIIFVSNNSTKSHDDYYNQLKSAGYDLEKSDLVRPPLLIINFLKNRNFDKSIFLIGMTPLRTELENAGFTVEQFKMDNPEESVPKYVQESIKINKNIGAVVADLDLNMRISELQKAASYLKNPDVLFVTGGSDKELCFSPGVLLIGPGSFHRILEDASGRKAHCLAKPSPELHYFIRKKLGVEDPSRVLFIGDSIPEDMGFATNSGYKKLLVLSGLTPKESVQKWNFPEEYKPDYYVDNLGSIKDMVKSKP